MEISYWKSRWENGNTGWHMNQVYPNLPAYWPELKLAKESHVLVPLCGKTLDMVWLRNQGFHVIGVDVSEKAARLFFQEHEIPFQKSSQSSFTVYQSEHIQFWVGDFFKLRPDNLPEIDAVYDKAALIALTKSTRARYAKTILSFCQPHTQLLLNTFEYEQTEMNGPPFAVEPDELKELFGKHFEIRLLYEASLFHDLPKFQTRGLHSYLIEKVYHLQPH